MANRICEQEIVLPQGVQYEEFIVMIEGLPIVEEKSKPGPMRVFLMKNDSSIIALNLGGLPKISISGTKWDVEETLLEISKVLKAELHSSARESP